MTHDELLKRIDQAAAEGWEELDLSGLGLEELPPEMGKLTGLKKLLLGKVEEDKWIGNSLTEIPAILFELTQLQELDLRKNQITVIPDEIAQLTNLTSLGLNNNQITTIPNAIAQLKKLVRFDLGTNQIIDIPDAITQLKHLEWLNLGTNQFTVIPDVIMQLKSLSWLGLHNNKQIAIIPDSIAQLENLTTLYLYRNQITEIPEVIAQLINLTTLDLSSNQIREIPTAIAQLTNLVKLDLGINQITAIPDAITQLSNLATLYLWKNQILAIPDTIAQLSSLIDLDLANNKITVIPNAVTKLSNLTKLWLSGNQITVIPNTIAQLINLTVLSLWGNQITEIPPSITSLPKLEQLDLRGNPLSIPKDILDSDAATRERTQRPAAKPILDYYFTTRDSDETHYLHEAKLLIIGEGGAGKTSLAQKLSNPDYPLTPETEDTSTQGIDILKWEFQWNGKDYCINIWDFGGQEIYHQTHQFFLTERSLYLLVADSRKEDTDHPYWLNIIRLLSDNSPVLLVQNEKQNRTCTLNLRELRAEFDALHIPIPINLADNRGLADLRKTIQRHLEDLLGDGIPFPNKWLSVRHSLENDNRNYISLPDYEATCRRHSIGDRSEMLTLSRFLHSLGICLHFQNDPILRQTLILKPNWGTAAVYKVLDCDRVKQNLGQFNDIDLADIWSNAEYNHLHHELLQLMKQFKVCYEIPRRPGNYIAPHLLSHESPHYPWDSSNNLTLRYRYKGFMPKGILTRFIVEMHKLIENVSSPDNACVWKTGVVLANAPNGNGARAEILENQTHREIQIRVSGNRPRDLLTIINHQFEDIHASFERLDYDTLIPCNCTACKPSVKPFTFPLDRLYSCLDRGRYQIECHESGEDVPVRGLIDGVIQIYADEQDKFYDSGSDHEIDRFHRHRYSSTHNRNHLTAKQQSLQQPSPLQTQSTFQPISIGINIHNANQQEQIVTDSAPKTTNINLPNANIGAIATDNAQATVSNNSFNQIHNASTAELLQLIATLRQTATAFPPDTQDAITIDLDDIEAEVQKPEGDRNPKKLKQRLIAILSAASVMVAGVDGAMDFANKAIDLGGKLGIELQLPGTP